MVQSSTTESRSSVSDGSVPGGAWLMLVLVLVLVLMLVLVLVLVLVLMLVLVLVLVLVLATATAGFGWNFWARTRSAHSFRSAPGSRTPRCSALSSAPGFAMR
ncbi:hypothetical protein [Streptomyces europaeiscabiei]|uniref:hypothetical protein n=1 Tax=Streptomyces europaeiscabiei TaxID=146819 RepID=UPI002E178EF7